MYENAILPGYKLAMKHVEQLADKHPQLKKYIGEQKSFGTRCAGEAAVLSGRHEPLIPVPDAAPCASQVASSMRCSTQWLVVQPRCTSAQASSSPHEGEGPGQ